MDKPVDNYCEYLRVSLRHEAYRRRFTGIRAVPNFPQGSNTAGGINSAILRYDGAPDQEPTTSATANPIVMNEADLHVSREKPHILPIYSNRCRFALSLSSILER